MLNFTSSLLNGGEGVLFTTKTPRVDIAHDNVDTKCSTVYFEDLNMGFSLNIFYDLQNLFAFFGYFKPFIS